MNIQDEPWKRGPLLNLIMRAWLSRLHRPLLTTDLSTSDMVLFDWLKGLKSLNFFNCLKCEQACP